MNCELPDVQAGFRKGRGTRDQIANICWIIKKAREFQKNIHFCFIDFGLWLCCCCCQVASVDSVRPHRWQPTRLPLPGILQARVLEWVAISFSSAWKWKVKVKPLSCVWLFATPWTAAHEAPLSMGFSRQEYWSGAPFDCVDHNKYCGKFLKRWAYQTTRPAFEKSVCRSGSNS